MSDFMSDVIVSYILMFVFTQALPLAAWELKPVLASGRGNRRYEM